MRKFPIEMKIFMETSKPKTFYEYIGSRFEKGLFDINFGIKEVFDMLDNLKAKREKLLLERNAVVDHEEEINKFLSDSEAKIRAEFEAADVANKVKIDNQIEVIDELIREEEDRLNSCENNEAVCDVANDAVVANENREGE